MEHKAADDGTQYNLDSIQRHRRDDIIQKRLEEDAKHLFNYSIDLICIGEASGYFRRINPAFERTLGFSEKELLDQLFVNLVHPDDIASTLQELEKLSRGITTVNFESRWRCKDDGYKWLSWNAQPKEDGTFYAVAHDITGQKSTAKAQLAVYEIADAASSAHTLDDLYRAVHDIVGKVMPVHNFYIAVLDETEKQISFPYFVDQYDAPPLPSMPHNGLTEYVMRTGRSLLCDREKETELAHAGEVDLIGPAAFIWLGVPLIIDHKTIGAMVVQDYSNPYAYDLSDQHMLEYVSTQVAKAIEQKRTEDKLRESEKRYRDLVENAQDVIFTISTSGIITSLNSAFEKITGWMQSEWIGKSFTSLVHPEDLSRARHIFERTIHGIASSPHQLRILCKDDKYVVGEFNSAQSTINGKVVGVIGIVRDVSERLLLEDQLRHAQKLESLGTLAGGIAHDFNNILSIILGHASLLQRSNTQTDKSITSIDAITQAIQRGSGLVRQLLTFARKNEVLFESVNLNSIVKDFVNMFHATFPKTISLTVDLHKQIQSIRGDVNQLHQVLLNLTVNARDAMLTGGTLTIRTEHVAGKDVRVRFAEASESEYVVLSVSDTGTGIDEATKRRMFEPFFTTKDIGQGTGLGLSVVYGVINSHKGFIDVESSPGVGTTFCLFFPVTQEIIVNSIKPQLEETTITTSGSETILLVEDEEMLRALVVTLLESSGYSVITAENGIEAVEHYKQHLDKISVVITDIGLPRMSGWDAFREMKKINPYVKAIFATGYIEPKFRDDIIAFGGKHFVQKPYVPAELLKRLRETIDAEK